MNKSSPKGMFLALILFSSLAGIFLANAYAQELVVTSSSTSVEPFATSEPLATSENVELIKATSHSFEETTIIEFLNVSKKEASSFRIWLGGDVSFKSFKTEDGWSGEKTPQGVIIFTSSVSVKPNESVKFGIKTNQPNPGINWKAIEKNGKEIKSGVTISGEQSSAIVVENGVLEDSVFRIIPEKPNVGDTIRVTGDHFGASQQFELFIDSQKIGTFQTNDKGSFITTVDIPTNQPSDRSEFIVKDSMGNERKISLRLGDAEDRIPPSEDVQLSIVGIPEIMQIGQLLDISGTAKPNSVVTGSIKNPDGLVKTERTAQVNSKGVWKMEEPILVPLDSKLGRYTLDLTDGRETISKSWVMESSKVIQIIPLKLKFESGDLIRFNGTAKPDIPVHLSLEDPLGIERFSNIIEPGNSGNVTFDYQTTTNVDKEGTWTLTATQDNDKEYIFVGLGQLPSIPVIVEFDKLSYKSSETATILLTGKPGEAVSLLIVDPSDKPLEGDIPIKIGDNGKTVYSWDLKGYSSGLYTLVISQGNSKTTKVFAVGLQTGSGDINISATKSEYQPNDSILILGNSNKNVLIKLTLSDPNGKKVKEIETFSDKNGKIAEGGFRIPSEAEPGIWEITAKSGSNFETIQIIVIAAKSEGLVITVSKGTIIPANLGKSIDIYVINAHQTVEIHILDPDEKVVDNLRFPASKTGEIKLPWALDPNLLPGTYIVTAEDAYDYAETTFQIN